MFIDELSHIRLTKGYNIKPFNCDDDDLNGFLFEDAKPALNELLAVTYLFENNDRTVAFYCLSNDKISADDARGRTVFSDWRLGKFQDTQFENLHSFPAVKIGRLGVDKDYQGKGIGNQILDYLKIRFSYNNTTGCRFITVDAYAKALGFYEKNDFIYLTNKDVDKATRLMYFDLSLLSDI